MTLHSAGPVEPGSTLETALEMNEPGLFFAFERAGAGTNAVVSPMVALLDVRDDQGRVIPRTAFHPDFLSDLRRWHLRFIGREYSGTNNANGVRSLDLTLAFPEERHFEFVVATGKGR